MSWLNARRGLCPRCGAALTLEGAHVDCLYCGCRAVVERRLRTFEPDPADPRPLRRLDWVEESAVVHCLGCGRALEHEGAALRIRCPACDSENKVERRLRKLLSEPRPPGPDNPHTLKKIWQAVRHPQLAERVVAAQDLHQWGSMNETLARHIPDILLAIQESDPRLGYALSEVVGRLLCSDERFHHDCVLEAAGDYLFRLDGCRALLFEIGMGPGSGLKLLLDVAQWAIEQGELEYCCTALWGASQILQRNYPDHPVLRQVLLYRLLYTTGPVQLWILRMVQSRQGVAMRYSADELLEFLDDASLENPLLADELATSIDEPPAQDAVEYEARLARLEKLQSQTARRVALGLLGPPPTGTSLRLLRRTTDQLIPWLEQPVAVAALGKILDSPAGVPQAIHDLVRQRGDDLPEELRRLYLQKVPNCRHLTSLEPRYYQSESRPNPFAEAEELYRTGLSRAVDTYQTQRSEAGDYGRRVANRTPLMAATEADRIRHLREQGHDPDEVNEQGWTALMFAAEAGRAELVAALLEAGARTDPRDSEGRTAFSVAAAGGHLPVLEQLLPGLAAGSLQEAFRQALRRGQPEVLAWTLAQGADPDTLEDEGRTPLLEAVLAERLDLLRQLLSAGAHVDHADGRGRTALMYAAERGLAAHVQLLLEHQADPNRCDQAEDTALALASRHGHLAVVRQLLGVVRDANAPGGDGLSPLASAQSQSHREVEAALRAAGANHCQDFRLVCEAIERRDLASLDRLLREGFEPDDEVAVHAVNRGNLECLRRLLDAEADLDSCDERGNSLLALAITRGKLDLFDELLGRGADPNRADHSGQTPLMVAALRGYLEVCRKLLAAGADPYARDDEDRQPLDYARLRVGCEPLEALLQ